MKHKLLYLACIVLLWSSCKKSEELIYPKEFSALNIWLGANAEKADSLTYNYAFKSLNDLDTISFSVRLSGLPSAVDREFQLKAVGGDTLRIKKDVHYQFPKYILKANAYTAVYPIYIKRSAEFKTKEGKIIFGLKEDDTFKKGIAERSDLIVILKDQFSKPANWDADPAPYRPLSVFFGTYSNVKFQFITTAIGRAATFKVRNNTQPLIPPDEIYYTQALYYQSRVKIELINYNAAHPGAPLKNEFGETVTFP
ncbi:hypothetical protein D3C87_214830 [compost metagenome]